MADKEQAPVSTAETSLSGRGPKRMRAPVAANANVDAVHQLEDDLKRVGENPARFPRTVKLIAGGPSQQAKKLIEEASELAIEAVRGDRPAALLEAADLLYHLIVLLDGMQIRFDEVRDELRQRRAIYGIAAKQQKNGGAPPPASAK
jgi:phosphoribosyl-ATP pyrophosphohydrolase